MIRRAWQGLYRPAALRARLVQSTSKPLSTATEYMSSSVTTNTDLDELYESLYRLQTSFSNRSTLHADNVLADMKKVDGMNRIIPLSFFFDGASIFAQRHDSLRLELLIRLANSNLGRMAVNDQMNGIDARGTNINGSRSRPDHSPFDKLVSFTVGEMIRCGDIEDALKLWVRISQIGYMTNRFSLDKIVGKMSTCGANELPSIDFTDKIHGMMKVNRWDQNPRYYLKILGVYRQHISWSSTVEDLEKGCERVEKVWSELCRTHAHALHVSSGEEGSSHSSIRGCDASMDDRQTELHALRVKSWVAAVTVCEKLRVAAVSRSLSSHSNSKSSGSREQQQEVDNAQRRLLELSQRYRDHALEAFGDLLKLNTSIVAQLKSASRTAAASVTKKIDVDSLLGQALTGSSHTSGGQEMREHLRHLVRNVRESLQAEVPSVVNHRLHIASASASASSTTPFPIESLRQLQRRSGESLLATTVVLPASTSLQQQSTATRPLIPHYDITRTRGLLRQAVAEVLVEVARQPGSGAAPHALLLQYLDICLSHTASVASQVPSSSARTAAAYASAGISAKPSLLAALARKSGYAANSAPGASPTDSQGVEWLRESASPRHRNAATFSDCDADWAEGLLSDIIRTVSWEQPSSGTASDWQRLHIEGVETLAAELLALAGRHGLVLGPRFYAAHIKALAGPGPGAGNVGGDWDWRVSLTSALRIVDSLDDSIGRSPRVSHGVVSMLCSSALATRESVDRALRLAAYELPAEGPVPGQALGADPSQPLPETWCTILDASVRVLEDEDLRQTLAVVEERTVPLSAVSRPKQPPQHPMARATLHDVNLIAARLRCYSRLRMGYKAMATLRALRVASAASSLSSSSSKGVQPHIINRHTYTWLINAVHHCRPSDEAEWRIVKNPSATCEWLLGEMIRDGVEANGRTLALLLKLHGKACQIAKTQGNLEASVRRMEEFVQECAAGGLKGHPKVPVTEAALREMVKVYCIAGLEEGAVQLLQTAEARYGIRVTAAAYEPLIFSYALLEKQQSGSGRPLALAEDVLTLMVNRGVAPSDGVADAILLGHLRGLQTGALRGSSAEHGVRSAALIAADALDRVQELYTAHSVRPSCAAILRLLDVALDAGDVHEARRVTVVIEQLFSEEERHDMVHYPFASHRQLQSRHERWQQREQARQAILGGSTEGDGKSASSSAHLGGGGASDDEQHKERWRMGGGGDAPSGETIHGDEEDVDDDDDDDDELLLLGSMPAPGGRQSTAPPPATSLRSRAVVPTERAALSREALERRFAARGLSIK